MKTSTLSFSLSSFQQITKSQLFLYWVDITIYQNISRLGEYILGKSEKYEYLPWIFTSSTPRVCQAREALNICRAPGWCPLVTTTSHAHCKGLCMHSGQHIQALSTTPHTHLSLGYLSGLGMCTPVSCSPSSGWIGEGPVQALKAGGGPRSRISSTLSTALQLGRGHGLKASMCPWPWGLMAPLDGER